MYFILLLEINKWFKYCVLFSVIGLFKNGRRCLILHHTYPLPRNLYRKPPAKSRNFITQGNYQAFQNFGGEINHLPTRIPSVQSIYSKLTFVSVQYNKQRALLNRAMTHCEPLRATASHFYPTVRQVEPQKLLKLLNFEPILSCFVYNLVCFKHCHRL